MRYSNIVLSTLVCLAASSMVHADILALQPVTNFQGTASQVFTDPPVGAVISFDDITVTGNGWDITKVTAFGFEGNGGGDPSVNSAVSLAFLTSPDFTTIGKTYAGTEVAVNNAFYLVFDQSIHLDPGTYYLTAYVTRALNPGGQWFFSTSQPSHGVPFFRQNPAEGAATEPASDYDLAFEIDGTRTAAGVAVDTPEPGSLTLLSGIGVVGAGLFARRRKLTRKGG